VTELWVLISVLFLLSVRVRFVQFVSVDLYFKQAKKLHVKTAKSTFVGVGNM
jgi:hypothetical protein